MQLKEIEHACWELVHADKQNSVARSQYVEPQPNVPAGAGHAVAWATLTPASAGSQGCA